MSALSQSSLDFQSFQAGLRAGEATLQSWIGELRRRIEAYPDPAVWIHRLPWMTIESRARELEQAFHASPDPWARFPLFGLPFAVKDNIDVAGTPTTAGCPDFAYTPARHAAVVGKLEQAGALLIGKTNLDQFATGLVGTRSPYGEVRNAFHPDYISGGSSSGSAVAVSAGLVSFALGTDTAGSGRVPAGFNNVVGLKPTRGLVSTRGVVPACRSLDCVSVFALTCEDAFRVLEALRGEDAEDAFSRGLPPERLLDSGAFTAPPSTFRFALPDSDGLRPIEGSPYAGLFAEAIATLEAMGGKCVEWPLDDFFGAARLLYHGPWVAERRAAFGDFLARRPEAVLPVIREVVAAGKDAPPESVFAGQYRLQELKARVHRRFMEADFLLLPTTPAHFTRAAVAADPIGTNSLIGTYTNFVNLLDLSAVSVPSGFRDPGLPFGVTMVGLPYREGYLASMASAFHARRGLTLGRTGAPLPPPAGPRLPEGAVPLAVAGLHLSGQPLNGQLLDRGARLRGTYRTAPVYRLHALRRGERHFPGLVRSPEGGASVEVEVWDMTRPALGDFLGLVKAPLGLGTVELEGGLAVTGFLCESYAVEDATDITAYGGWLPYLRSLS